MADITNQNNADIWIFPVYRRSYTNGRKVSITNPNKTASKNVAVTVSEPEQTGEFNKFTGNLVEGDYVIYYGDGAMKASVTSNRLDYLLYII